MRIAAIACLALVSSTVAAQAEDDHGAEARDLLSRAIAFDTSASGGQVPAFAQYLSDVLSKGGFPAQDIKIVPFENTASLLVRYRGDGSGGKPIALLAHMDVVKARREDWQREPFELVEEDGFFFGRGTADNKSGLISLVSTFLRLKRENFHPTRDLVLVFTGDEEVAQRTVQDLLENHRQWVDAEFALNSDSGYGRLDETTGAPAIYYLRTAEKGFASFTITIRNPGGHSRAPRSDNAIYELADVLIRIRAERFPVRWNETTIGAFRMESEVRDDETGAAMARFAENPADESAISVLSKDPFLNGQIRTTCVATMLAAGHADNALPQSATATVNCRLFPGERVESVHQRLEALAGSDAEVAYLNAPYESEAASLRTDVIEAVTAAVHAGYPGVRILPAMTLGSSDGLFFVSAGIPAYGTGESFMKESDDFSHGLNERIPVSSFYKGLEHWYVLLTHLAGRKYRGAAQGL